MGYAKVPISISIADEKVSVPPVPEPLVPVPVSLPTEKIAPPIVEKLPVPVVTFESVKRSVKLWSNKAKCGPRAYEDEVKITREVYQRLSHWPRGRGPGELLLIPEVDDTPLNYRGVSKAWTDAAARFTAFVPTKVMVLQHVPHSHLLQML